MEHSAYTGAPSLEELTSAFRRRWWVVAICAILGIGCAAGYLLVAQKTWVATASVLVNPVGGAGDNVVDGARTNSLINLDTEAQLVKSQKVSSRAAALIPTTEKIGQLVQQVGVEVPANTNVLRISFTAGGPLDAAAGANAYAQGYLDNRKQLAQQANQDQEKLLQDQIVTLTEIYKTATGADKDIALNDLTALKARYNALIGTAVIPGEIISDALPPNHPASPDRLFIMLTGMALGVLAGLVLVAWLEHRDGRFYDWRVIERRLGLPVLANIPGKKGRTAHLFAAHSPSGQAFIELRTALASGLTGTNNVVLLASPIRGHGLDMVVANLAASAARANITTAVLVVDENSHLTDLVGLPLDDGLADVLTGSTTLSAVSQPVPDIPGLIVVAAGRDLNERVEDIEGAGILPVIRTLKQRSDLVLVLSAPHSESADAQFLGFHSDASIPVVEMAKVRRKALVLAVREWELVGTPVPGVVTVPAVSEPEPWPPPVRTGRKGKKRQ